MNNTDLGIEIIIAVVFYSSKYSGSLIYFYKRINLNFSSFFFLEWTEAVKIQETVFW
jgi:hypothetical protein